ncbi:MAG: exodeoxyribonuclease V subunit beta [Chromatiaceae bacterium]|nr:exodeoxyribonuclease V subunit beta [Chromatiaceae bacterium]
MSTSQALTALGGAAPTQMDPLRFPLHGSRLIEASAGTGKTHTIASLYVRLVLGHGETEPVPPPGHNPPEILVVTFTLAAAQELRERIRRRLAEAADYFRAPAAVGPAPSVGDELLHPLRAAYPAAEWPAKARQLQLAAEWMDEAAISTIHAWCHRMLREHAFDSDSLFSQTLETDQSELRAEVVRDYWRTFMVPLTATAAAEMRRHWAEPATLEKDLLNLLDQADKLEPAPDPAVTLSAALAARQQLKAPWHNAPQPGAAAVARQPWTAELKGLLDAARARKAFRGQQLKINFYTEWLKKLQDWTLDPLAVKPAFEDDAAVWTRLTPAGLQEIWLPGKPLVQHPALEAMASLRESLAALPDPRPPLLRHAARWVAARFAREQTQRAQMGFNDLLTRLAAALEGPNGPALAKLIRRQFPVALIDEFQDTDPVQYRIFDAIYQVASNDPATALVLIGDPKQAIYAFRGADIYTYLAARRACSDRLYTLKTNYRATEAMVTAANRCFQLAEERVSGTGAFLFRAGTDNPVPFVPADARGREDALYIHGQPAPALTAWWLPAQADDSALQKDAYREAIAHACASEIVRLLNLGQAGRAGFVTPGGRGQRQDLRPADLAILVYRRREADLIRRALAQRGVRSVYLSDQDSVYRSPQAAELQYWLAACAAPDDPRRLRAALATTTLGRDWAELDALNWDELAWEERVLQFRSYRDHWRSRGVLPMLRRLLDDFGVPARLLGTDEARLSGERVLTDLLHLAELLQQASTQLDGAHALIRHLAEQRRDAQRDIKGDARQIRLESDADLVKVVTVHKAKGLEYPLVFLPFAADHRPVRADDLPLKWHDDQGRLQLALAAAGDVIARADHERLGEDLRKLYVALTRARYATWVGLAPLADFRQSPFGYLLFGSEDPAVASASGLDASLADALAVLRGESMDIAVIPAPAATVDRYQPVADLAATGAARDSCQAVREPWWIASYSALRTLVADPASTTPLVVGPQSNDLSAETPAEDRYWELQAERIALPNTVPMATDHPGQTPPRPCPPAPGTPHAFPRGAAAGSFLHLLLEWAATQGFARVAAEPALLRDSVARHCQVRGWESWISPLTDWLLRLITQPLTLPALAGEPAARVSLAGLATAVPELEFWLAAHQVDARTLDRLVSAHTLGGAPRPALATNRLNGMLKGFVDLVFEHRGRYYVADYKSNWLGADDAAYTPAALQAAVLHARYELQYVLYLFALHRQLKARLPDYDYDRHVGGAVYLFVRGIAAPGQGLHAERPPRALIEALDALFAQLPAEPGI